MELLTIEEVADRLRVSVLTVRWLCGRRAASSLRSRSVVV
jgi:orotate phosphoribosyltransferase-like protein